ncbi:MAG: DnaJ domain-containing protein [Pseudanabaenaceae cyanobacterium bins.68]|nr:DnaJ domain-containing protein [Pseudanabaenaceae cyanobacterium bins.68]
MQISRALRINRGISQYQPDFQDYYAILGIPVTATAQQVRKRYLSIAKHLHPDVYGRPPEEKIKATRYFSRLVNPAYSTLNQERERIEYAEILRLLAKRLLKRNERLAPQSEAAKKLLYFPKELQYDYEKAVLAIAQIQYEQLDQILEHIAQLSELNLVFVLVREGYQHFNAGPSTLGRPASSGNTSFGQQPPRPPKPLERPANSAAQHITMAEQLVAAQQWSLAIQELRAALQIDPNSSKSHALLGYVYMQRKLTSMAKSSFKQALKLNPNEPLAKENFAKLEGQEQPVSKPEANKTATKDKKGGFFGWLSGS